MKKILKMLKILLILVLASWQAGAQDPVMSLKEAVRVTLDKNKSIEASGPGEPAFSEAIFTGVVGTFGLSPPFYLAPREFLARILAARELTRFPLRC
jgi:hypothetical protein